MCGGGRGGGGGGGTGSAVRRAGVGGGRNEHHPRRPRAQKPIGPLRAVKRKRIVVGVWRWRWIHRVRLSAWLQYYRAVKKTSDDCLRASGCPEAAD